MPERFYKISSRSIIPGDWGDYGDILQHGMTAHSRRIGDRLALERTGPFIPPITFPGIGDVLLTEEARSSLAASGLTGFTFRPVEKKLIVRLDWEKWKLSDDEPPLYPEQGEPENYILGQEHSPETATMLGEIWELVVPKTVQVVVIEPENWREPSEYRIDASDWDGTEIFRSVNVVGMYLTERARNWFLEHWADYIDFHECRAN
jgi:hypothetical protein